MSQQALGSMRTGDALFRHPPQYALARRDQRNLRGSEEGIHRENGGHNEETIAHRYVRRALHAAGSSGLDRIFPLPLRKILKYLNLSITVLLVAVLAVIYWVAFRTLPQTSGELVAPISQSARVMRDERGVPHIEAATWEDAIFLPGYVTAQDRLWRIDALRRLASG